jgi:ABC-type dipeptide/oligopeptide/nickel transport system ATPase component
VFFFHVRELQCEFGLANLLISHSLPAVSRAATRIGVLRAGKLVEIGTTEEILHHPAQP